MPKVTQSKIRRALDAMMDILAASDYDGSITSELDRACDALREYGRHLGA